MAITINREQRDAIYSQIRTDITGFNDIELDLRAGHFDAARQQSQRMTDDARLLDDLGWEPDPGRDEFTLTMPPADLARLLGRLNDDAGRLVRAHILDPIEEREHAAELLIAQTTYSTALAQLVAE
jgi:hypothetical protein